MNEDAVKAARASLAELQRHYDALAKPPDIETIEREWALLLHYSDQIYQKLRLAPRTNVEREWLKMVECERKTDPLLSYAHHARIVSHHGIKGVTELGEGILVHRDARGNEIGVPAAVPRLVPVKTRGGAFPVPENLGIMRFTPSIQETAMMLEMAMRSLVQGAEHVHKTGRIEA